MTVGIGETLRSAREELGRTLADAAQSLRIRTEYVEALEDEDFGVFGADTYARGHLRNYARYLGLDPEPLVEQYDRYVRTDDQNVHRFVDAPVAIHQREPLPRWVVGAGVLVAVVGAVVVIGMVGSRTPPPADPNDVLVTDSPTTTAPESPEPTPTTESPSPTPEFEGVNLLLAFEGDCWVDILVDGQTHPRANSTLTEGETLTLEAEERITVTFGNAGAVIAELNGANLGSPGGPGEVVTVTYGPDGVVEE